MIKHFIFDLGQVIVKVELEPFFIKFAEAFNIDSSLLKESENNGAHREFMTGKISGNEFHRKTYQYFNHFVPLERFKAIWISMLNGEIDGSSDIINRLHRQEYSLALLSNIDPWHFEYCEQHIPVLQKFERRFLSYEVMMKKPDAEIFLYVVDQLNAAPEQCLLIDDSSENIHQASKLDIQTIQFKNSSQLERELRSMGITI